MEPQATPVPPTPPIPTPLTPEPVQPPIQPLTQPMPLQEQPDSKMSQKLLIPSIVLLVIAVVLVAFKLILTKKVVTPPQPSPTVSTQPTLSPTPDPTANWKTYADPKGVYSFKYPSDWTTSKDVGLLNDPGMKFILDVQTKNTILNVQDWTKINVCTKFATASDQNGCTTYVSGPIENSIQFTFLAHYGGMHTVFKYGGIIFNVSMDAREPNPNFEETKGIYNQILSTFKFLGATSSANPASTQKACTLEAKLCPDGSSVGRTGPNCEFAPCP